MLLPSPNPIKCHEEFVFLQPMFPLIKRFDNVSPYSEGLDAFILFTKKQARPK